MDSERYYSEIKKRYGNITRARGCFLYTQKNVRLTDLWQEGGRAILGWDAPARTVFKNVLSKGLSGSFETPFFGRLEKAVSALLRSRRKIFLFSQKKDAMRAALFLNPGSSSVYKPFCGADYSAAKSVVVAPPLPWTNNFFVLAVLDEADEKSAAAGSAFGAENGGEAALSSPAMRSDFAATFSPEAFPPALLAAGARSIYDLIAALNGRTEKDFFIYDAVLTKFFVRTSCWLRPKVPKEKYDDFVLAALDARAAVSPDWNADSLVPFGADRGVLKKLGEADAAF